MKNQQIEKETKINGQKIWPGGPGGGIKKIK